MMSSHFAFAAETLAGSATKPEVDLTASRNIDPEEFAAMQYSVHYDYDGDSAPDSRDTLFPVNKHTKNLLFDYEKLQEYMSKNLIVVTNTSTATTYMSEDHAANMSKEYDSKYSAKTKGKVVGVTVSAAIEADFKTTESSQVASSFSQAKTVSHQYVVTFPDADLENSRNYDLRPLLKDTIKADIDAVSCLDDARECVAALGPTYFHKAFFGGVMTMSAKADSSSGTSSKDLQVALEAEMSFLKRFSASGEYTYTEGTQCGFNNTSFSFEVKALGGSTAAARSGNFVAWEESLGEGNGENQIIDFELAPISNLAKHGTPAEGFLLQACEEEINRVRASLGKFTGAGKYEIKHDSISLPSMHMSAHHAHRDKRHVVYQSSPTVPTEWRIETVPGTNDLWHIFAKVEGDDNEFGLVLEKDKDANGQWYIILERNNTRPVEWSIPHGFPSGYGSHDSPYRFFLKPKVSTSHPHVPSDGQLFASGVDGSDATVVQTKRPYSVPQLVFELRLKSQKESGKLADDELAEPASMPSQ